MSSLLSQALHQIGLRYAAWRRRQQALAELSQLDDRSLADIGITRGEIPYVIANPRPSRAPVWAKANRHSHAH